MSATRVAWLIEIQLEDGYGPLWWRGGGVWDCDADKAINFSRKIDAEQMLPFVSTLFRHDSTPYAPTITEHIFE